MTIIQDTREQSPIRFPKDEVLEGVCVETLQVGDYRARFRHGLSKTVFERKSISDLWGTLLKGHKRFVREIEKARVDGVELVLIIECSISRVLDGFERSEFQGKSLLKMLGTLYYKYGLRTVFCSDRLDMAKYMLWTFKSEGYNYGRLQEVKGKQEREEGVGEVDKAEHKVEGL